MNCCRNFVAHFEASMGCAMFVAEKRLHGIFLIGKLHFKCTQNTTPSVDVYQRFMDPTAKKACIFLSSFVFVLSNFTCQPSFTYFIHHTDVI
jgi:hypothetical protein